MPRSKSKTMWNEPIFVTQLDNMGNPEKIMVAKNTIEIACQEKDCPNIRFVKSQDVQQVKFCKPCQHKHRVAKINEKIRALRARKQAEKNITSQIKK